MLIKDDYVSEVHSLQQNLQQRRDTRLKWENIYGVWVLRILLFIHFLQCLKEQRLSFSPPLFLSLSLSTFHLSCTRSSSLPSDQSSISFFHLLHRFLPSIVHCLFPIQIIKSSLNQNPAFFFFLVPASSLTHEEETLGKKKDWPESQQLRSDHCTTRPFGSCSKTSRSLTLSIYLLVIFDASANNDFHSNTETKSTSKHTLRKLWIVSWSQ